MTTAQPSSLLGSPFLLGHANTSWPKCISYCPPSSSLLKAEKKKQKRTTWIPYPVGKGWGRDKVGLSEGLGGVQAAANAQGGHDCSAALPLSSFGGALGWDRRGAAQGLGRLFLCFLTDGLCLCLGWRRSLLAGPVRLTPLPPDGQGGKGGRNQKGVGRGCTLLFRLTRGWG